ncbi:UDP-N-acetylmuramoyl-tripeptide--D-alanyl-D-alanine ligase [Flammeovirgaceae bacterium SG7u.111]|nr:UDP-N-acetylmuramoyl-tripeptide--D-alanyl-D-alanine ligase [Flammeovirgaceae bacterium SG7u.132]WPO38609.1 UDP-N-acetylmuramoyl-tripeptide--D-alanyl-D-alanine ligase [Flammeovirgaceae bacterium SG7u.111]
MELAEIYQLFSASSGVCTDTRKITDGCIFFALKGASFNGNAFAKDALAKGASYAVVDEEQFAGIEKAILVEDVLECLQKLANLHRKTLGFTIVGITGSNGKTTTKELAYRVLSQKYETASTPGNFNNHIGVPLTLLGIGAETEMVVLELGDNHPGEIMELCQISEPDFGLITNIGKDHLEGFGSMEANIRAKSELFDHLLRNGGNVFVNSIDPILKNMSKRFASPIMYGAEGDAHFAQLESANPFIHYRAGDTLVKTQMTGAYNFENMMAAIALGQYFEVEEEKIHQAIGSYIPQNNRSQWIEKGSNTILLDAYNANPSSVEAAIESFAQLETDKEKVLILGDMFELGSISQSEHQNMVALAKQQGFAKLIFCGNLYYEQKNKDDLFFPKREELERFILKNPFENTCFLLKGSRGMALEKLVEVI